MRKYRAWQLAWALIRAPRYEVLICADDVLPPSPWSDEMRIEIDHHHRVIRICCELT